MADFRQAFRETERKLNEEIQKNRQMIRSLAVIISKMNYEVSHDTGRNPVHMAVRFEENALEVIKTCSS